MDKTLLIFGTRPELIKLAPIIYEFKKRGLREKLVIINTNQHNCLLYQVVEVFNIDIDYTLDIINNSNNLSILSSEIIRELEILVKSLKKKCNISSIIVQGDTSSTLCASLVAFYNKITVHYVEAGLRTYDTSKPFPEEFHRRLICLTAAYLYAPTESAKQNLLKEGFAHQKVIVTGNTIIDSIQLIEQTFVQKDFTYSQDIILCTIHRRENMGNPLVKYIQSLIKLAISNSDCKFIIIRHPNPQIKEALDKHSSKFPKNLILSNSKPYPEMIGLIKSSKLIISDSGGLQEEASYFLKPVIVLRNSTERIESIKNGIAICINKIDDEICSVFDKMVNMKIEESNRYIYGNGSASEIIVNNILSIS